MTCEKHGYKAAAPCPDCVREAQSRAEFVREASLRIAGTAYSTREDLSDYGARMTAKAVRHAAEILADELGFPRPAGAAR